MPRKAFIVPRPVMPDRIFQSRLATRFINCIMRKGKKTVAERIFYGALLEVERRTKQNPLDIVAQALRNVMPEVEVRSRRVGGATYQVPMEVRPKRKVSLGIRWLVEAARSRPEHTMIRRLAAEFIDAANNTGGAVKKREDTYRMAEANRAFAHYRW